MYIDPFLAGVLATVGVEIIAVLILLFYMAWKSRGHKK